MKHPITITLKGILNSNGDGEPDDNSSITEEGYAYYVWDGSHLAKAPSNVTIGGKKYRLIRWESEGNIEVTDPESAETSVIVGEDGTLIACYKPVPKHTLTIIVSPEGSGTTEPSPGSYEYSEGRSITVNATAYEGYEFDYWKLDGEIAGYEPSVTITMDRDHTLIAVFKGANGDNTGATSRASTSRAV